MMTIPGAKRAVAKLSLVKFFPGEPETRAALMEELAELCQSDEEALWLAGRVQDLCKEWPGVMAMRQIYFNKHSPRNPHQRQLDRACSITDAFPDGVLSENQYSSRQIAGPEMKALPAGATVSGDPAMDATVIDLAAKKSMPKPDGSIVDEKFLEVQEKLRQLGV